MRSGSRRIDRLPGEAATFGSTPVYCLTLNRGYGPQNVRTATAAVSLQAIAGPRSGWPAVIAATDARPNATTCLQPAADFACGRNGRCIELTHRGDTRTVRVGDVLYLHDGVTGFSGKNCMRWCVVTAVVGRHVRVVGRSASRTDGVPVPKNVMEEFSADGWMLRPPLRIPMTDATGARNIGCLPSPYLEQVLFFVDEDMP
jgi:hypothetical protein